MKIMHINSYYCGSTFYKNLYDQQINNDYDIDVFVPVPTSYAKGNIDLGTYTKISINHNKFDRYLFHLKHYKIYKDIVNLYKVNKYSIIHAHSLFSNGYIAMKLKRDYNIPYIVAVRNTDVNIFFEKMPYLRKLGIEILKEAEKIIFLSEPYRTIVINNYTPEYLKKEILGKSVIVPNGIDNFWLENKLTKKTPPDRKKVKLLYVGVLDKNKNITTTLKVIENLQKKGYSVEFTVVGKIKDNKVYNQIKGLSYVNYISPKPKEKLLGIYRENDIFVMTSIKETFGLVYAEAMSQGLPVIYTKQQGFDGQFKMGEVGFGVDCFNVEEISESIIKIMNNYINMSNKCIELCDKFSWDKIHQQYVRIYLGMENGL